MDVVMGGAMSSSRSFNTDHQLDLFLISRQNNAFCTFVKSRLSFQTRQSRLSVVCDRSLSLLVELYDAMWSLCVVVNRLLENNNNKY